MTDTRPPTYEQLSALCAQMAAALEGFMHGDGHDDFPDAWEPATAALTAYRALSPDPQWQRVPGGCVVVPEEPDLTMCSAGKTAINPKLENAEGVPYARRVYRAMLAVRPENRARGEG